VAATSRRGRQFFLFPGSSSSWGSSGQARVKQDGRDGKIPAAEIAGLLEAGGGIVIKIQEVVGLYATLSWTNDVDGNTVHSLGGNFGVRVAW
jgi:hypothetical protein